MTPTNLPAAIRVARAQERLAWAQAQHWIKGDERNAAAVLLAQNELDNARQARALEMGWM